MPLDKLFISAGEPSGDFFGGYLIREIKNLHPELYITAIGGDNISGTGAKLLYHIRDTAFMGFTEILKHLPFLWKVWRNTIDFIKTEKPNLVILIDYPGFNLRLARAAHKNGIPVIYYITPQVWAWHSSRVKKIKKYIKEVICIFPFEEPWFRKHGVNATFVGHPLLDIYDNKKKSIEPSSIIRTGNVSHLIGLFPGSRRQEVNRHLDIMVDSIKALRKNFPELKAVVAVAPDINTDDYESRLPYKWLQWIRGKNYEIMQQSDLLILSSGTSTVEAAIHQTPMVVIYRLSQISYWLGKLLIRVPYISMVNLISDIQVVPELIQHKASPENISIEAERILKNKKIENETKIFLKNFSSKIGPKGASRRAAEIIVHHIHPSNEK